MTLRADWNDVLATMEVAPIRAEVAVMGVDSDDHTFRFELVTATDEPGELLVSRQPGLAGDGEAAWENIEITLSARIGMYGDAPRERVLLEAVARRLEQLRGRDTAPLDW